MSISAYIKEIGRGKDGARPLQEDQAHDLMSQVLDGRVTDLEIGAFAVAMRIKGESTAELSGFLKAATERCIALRAPGPAVEHLAHEVVGLVFLQRPGANLAPADLLDVRADAHCPVPAGWVSKSRARGPRRPPSLRF